MKNTINTINAANVNINISTGAQRIPEGATLRDLLSILGDVQKAESTPTPKALRERKLEDGSVEQIAPLGEALDGACKVYANGYAVYSNDVGTTVLWLPDCRSFTYYFDELKDTEKEYLSQRCEIDEGVMEAQPWFMAVMLRGDHQVERNGRNRSGNRKDKNQNVSLEEITEKEEAQWRPGCRFENPESAYIRKETLKEELSKLTEKQREVFLLYHQAGYNQFEIAEILGISQQAVDYRLEGAEKKMRAQTIRF